MQWKRIVVSVVGVLNLLLCLCSPAQGSAAENPTQTNDASLLYLPLWVDFCPPEPIDAVPQNFSAQVLASDSFEWDRFAGPASRLAWERRLNARGYRAIDDFNSAGARMFKTIAADSLRDAVVMALPSEYWQDTWSGWLGDTIAGTIGDAEEEQVDYTSVSYSALRSSWESSHRDAGFSWGFRPWRTNPYLYFLAHAGHLEGRPLLTLEGRSGYQLFGSTKCEGRLALALPRAFQLSGGASFDPARMHGDDHGRSHFAVTLERVLHATHQNIPDALFFVGFRSGRTSILGHDQQENLLLAGFFHSW